jgi:hypothetical protein
MDMNGILIIVGIVVLLGVAGGCVFGIMKLRQVLGLMDTKVEPKLDEIRKITGGLVPAVEQAEGVLQSVNVAMDSLDTTLVEVDGKLAQIKQLSGMAIAAGEAGSQIAQQTKATVKDKVKGTIARLR